VILTVHTQWDDSLYDCIFFSDSPCFDKFAGSVCKFEIPFLLFRVSWSLLDFIKLVTKFIIFDELGVTKDSSA